MIVILIGESASGKDTALANLKDYGCKPIVSSTTRAMREGEQEGVNYHYISEKEFLEKVESGVIFEHREYDSSKGKVYYGAEKIMLDPDAEYAAVRDVDGAKAYIKAYGRQNCFVVKIDVPEKIRYERALAREGFDNSEYPDPAREDFDREFALRLEDDKKRFSKENLLPVVNFYADGTKWDKDTAHFTIIEALGEYEKKMKEYEEQEHLHTDFEYPQVIVTENTDENGFAYYRCMTRTDFIVEMNRKSFREVEGMESLDQCVGTDTYTSMHKALENIYGKQFTDDIDKKKNDTAFEK